jgi:hypothetical protein
MAGTAHTIACFDKPVFGALLSLRPQWVLFNVRDKPFKDLHQGVEITP